MEPARSVIILIKLWDRSHAAGVRARGLLSAPPPTRPIEEDSGGPAPAWIQLAVVVAAQPRRSGLPGAFQGLWWGDLQVTWQESSTQ